MSNGRKAIALVALLFVGSLVACQVAYLLVNLPNIQGAPGTGIWTDHGRIG